MNAKVEFSLERSRSYKSALKNYPDAWEEDSLLMLQYLAPSKNEVVLEIGAGSGFFSFDISDLVGDKGHLFVVDPSPEQLSPIKKAYVPNITIMQVPAEEIELPEGAILDAIWSRGAFHHVKDKVATLSHLAKNSRKGTRLVICDIFAGTQLSAYFDTHVAVTCTTGHEVCFLSKEFATSLCKTTGWDTPSFIDVALQWHFETKEDIGKFLSLLHSNKPEFSSHDSLAEAEAILGIKKTPRGWALNWPMTVMMTTAK
ncbi:MAG: arsenite methyltransferase [Motiliproteus sp.]|jgi:arsenite methyltransferase